MWVITDTRHNIVIASFSTRAQAYNYNRGVKWLDPSAKCKVEKL